MRPLVSIIMPARNTATWVGQAVLSVRAQTFQNWELLVVDDASTDQTSDLARKAAGCDHGRRVHITRLAAHVGAAVARNWAIERAAGRWIAFLDSDDLWTPRKLERMLDFATQTCGRLIFHSYGLIDARGNSLGLKLSAPTTVDYSTVLYDCVLGCSTAMYDVYFFGKVYMPDLRMRHDHALWLQLLKRIDRAHGLDEVLAYYRVRKDSLSAKKHLAALWQWKLYRTPSAAGLRLPDAIFLFAKYAVCHIFKKRYHPLALENRIPAI